MKQHIGLSRKLVLGLWLIASACSDNNAPTTYVASTTDYFVNDSGDHYNQANQILQGDYVFALNMSRSMSTYRDNLFNNMGRFADHLRNQSIDYRIAFVQGTTQSTNPIIPSGFLGSVLTPSTNSTLETQILNQIYRVGTDLAPNQMVMLEATRRSMNSMVSSFVRPSAQLIYVFVSDEDDTTSSYTVGGPSVAVDSYSVALKAHKSNPSYINARAVVLGQSVDCPLDSGSYSQSAGTRIANLATLLESADTSKAVRCLSDDFSDTLEDLAVNVTRNTNRFTLQNRPVPSSIVVLVNGVSVPSSGNWTYQAATNEIVFEEASKPDFGDTLDIRYDIYFTLSQAPVESSIEVRVNNSVVTRDNTNGWSYIEADNRIQFNGSAKPSDSAEIRVIYQPR